MAKGYYESSGSDYLNDSPSVSKNGQGDIPHHIHDERYYRKDEMDASQRDFDSQFSELERNISQVRSGLENKASIYHTHDYATSTVPGFMSAEDKRALDNLTGGTGRTNVHISDTQARTIPAGVATKLIFNTKIADSNSEYSMPTDTFRAKSSGMYFITGTVELENNTSTTGRVFLQVARNNELEANFGINYIMGGTQGGVAGSTCLYLTVGDDVVFRIWSSLQVNTRGKEYAKITKMW